MEVSFSHRYTYCILTLTIFIITSIFLSSTAFCVLCGDATSDCAANCTINITVFLWNSTSAPNVSSMQYGGSCTDASGYSIVFDQGTNYTDFMCGYYYAGFNESDYGASKWQSLFAITGNNCSTFNITTKNQTENATNYHYIRVYESGNRSLSSVQWVTNLNGEAFMNLSGNKIYDVNLTKASVYKGDIWYKGARSPANISAWKNKKWGPESTLSTSRLFTAGHIVPVQITILSPWRSNDVANISLEDSSPNGTSIVSNILFEKSNSTGVFYCDHPPDNSTYYFINKTDCNDLTYLNVTGGDWLRVTYRVRIEGPSAYSFVGQQKNYTFPTAFLRFDVVAS